MHKQQKIFSYIVLIAFSLIGAHICMAQTTVHEGEVPNNPTYDAHISAPLLPLPDSAAKVFDSERSTIDRLRKKAEYQHRLNEIACYKKFFVNACLEKEQKQFVEDMGGLRRREINNNQMQRDYDASQRVARQAQEEAKRQAERPKEEMRQVENRAAYERKVKAIEQRQAAMHSQQSQRERENNLRAFNEKQQEAKRHREALEARKAENMRRFNEAQQQTQPAQK